MRALRKLHAEPGSRSVCDRKEEAWWWRACGASILWLLLLLLLPTSFSKQII